jgi:hypothetical protein
MIAVDVRALRRRRAGCGRLGVDSASAFRWMLVVTSVRRDGDVGPWASSACNLPLARFGTWSWLTS